MIDLIDGCLKSDNLNLTLLSYYELKLRLFFNLKKETEEKNILILINELRVLKNELFSMYKTFKNNLDDLEIKLLATKYQDYWVLNYQYQKQYEKTKGLAKILYTKNDFELPNDFWLHL